MLLSPPLVSEYPVLPPIAAFRSTPRVPAPLVLPAPSPPAPSTTQGSTFKEELFIDAKGVSMPSPGQAWGTKAFLVDGAQAQPTGDEAFIRRVEAVPMKVMFEPREGTDQPIDGIDVLSHAEIDVKVLPWVVDGAGGLGAGKTSGAGTRGVDLNAAIGGRTGDSDTNGGERSNN